MKKIFTLLTTAAMLCNMFAVTSFAEENGWYRHIR